MSSRFVRRALAFGCAVFCGCSAWHSTPESAARGNGAPAPSGGGSIVIDGAFDDWGSTPPDARRADDPGPARAADAADIVAVATRMDARYVYLRLDLAQPANLYGLPGTVSIEVDADGDPSTGADADGLAGVDLSIDLSPRVDGRATSGAALRVMRNGAVVKTTDTYPLDFVLLPTVASSRAELRLARGRRLDSASAPLFTGRSYRVQVAVHDAAGALRYRLPAFSATLAPLDTTPRPPARDPLARAPGTQFRALVWNVANEGLRDRPDHFRRIIDAIDPDLLVLDEVGGVLGRDGAGKFLASLGGGGGAGRAPWRFTYGGGGGYQRTVIATRTSVAELPEFAFIPFPDSVSSRLLALVPAATQANQRANLAAGVATGGAVVTLNGRRVAVFGVDLQSAGNGITSWQELRRQTEARIVRDRAEAAIRAHGPVDAVIAAGDHNLVGTRAPLDLIREIGRAFDGTPLVSANPLQLDGATAATWEGSGGPFPPGRLDWFSFTGASLEVAGGFVFDVADLSDRWRRAHGLEADDSKRSSDHRPVVVDVRWRTDARR